jgi:hypothetical protein
MPNLPGGNQYYNIYLVNENSDDRKSQAKCPKEYIQRQPRHLSYLEPIYYQYTEKF